METLSKQLFPAGGENLVKWSGPVCFPNTRVEILDEIRVKMDDAEGKFIVWLNGMAGSGKSTIARTVAQGYAKQNRLAAMFSFSRDEADRSHAAKFIPSIALQLAGLSSAFHAHICEVLAENPNIPRSDIKEQWSKLFLEPLSTLEADFPQLPLYLVVDALDACDDLSHIYGILQLFAEAKPLETKLRILVTSRPETTVRVAFRNMPGTLYQNVALNKIPQATVESDISTFFGHKIEEIRSISESLSPDWPGEEKLSLLVSRALGSFIYAETVCRFIRERAKDGLQDDALQSILSTTVKQDDLARNTTAIRKATTSEVDLLYNEILEDIFKAIGPTEDDQQPASIFKKVAGTTITLFEPLSTIAMAGLLDIAEGNVNEQLQHLQSFLEVPESEEAPVRLLHSSFRDFLLDNKRCSNQQVWIDQKGAHETIARDCMRLMSSQLQHISNLHLRGMQANEAALEIIGGDFPPELQYACRYWIKHLRQSDICLVENDQIHVFLQQFSFYWIEALGLMSRASESILAISLLESIVAVSASEKDFDIRLTFHLDEPSSTFGCDYRKCKILRAEESSDI
jgi:NACHT domain